MSHQTCKDVTKWVDPIQQQVEQCLQQDCNWFCLCCNKWLCALVWVVLVAGRWVTTQVCELVADAADFIVKAFTFIVNWVITLVRVNVEGRSDPRDINKLNGLHVIQSWAQEGGLDFKETPLVGPPEIRGKSPVVAFNNADVPGVPCWYNDSGVRAEYRIAPNGHVYFQTALPNLTSPAGWKPIVHDPNDPECWVSPRYWPRSPLAGQSGPLGISFDNLRQGELVKDLTFDLIAANGNRVFARQAGTANFYFTLIQHEFLNYGFGPPSLPPMADPKLNSSISRKVPGVYTKLDPEQATSFDDPVNPALDPRFAHHPSLKSFEMASGGAQAAADRVLQGLMVVKVIPGAWHKLDTRPPISSGQPPDFVDTFPHVTYDGLEGATTQLSIKIYGVLDIGVGHTHRVLHYETRYGDETDTMSRYAYPIVAGPVEDGGGFCDGMCNFYVLCKIGVTNPVTNKSKHSYGILWIDEQTYFSERWRLVGFNDGECFPLRNWGISESFSSGNAPDKWSYWSPFEASWDTEPSLIKDSSRMAVSKHTLLVTGRGHMPVLHPDNTQGTIGSEEPPGFLPVLYSSNFTFATSDRTWRWRGYPCAVVDGVDWQEIADKATCYPDSLAVREDMTIYLKGTDADGTKGYWYQKCLPADNTQVPDKEHLLPLSMPGYGFMHAWNFMERRNFEIADHFSHFGVHRRAVDSRSRYYLLDIVDPSKLPPDFESIPWKDEEDRLYWFYAFVLNYSPSRYNKGSFFKILDRRPIGFIAVLFDKRDDELPELNRIGPQDIALTGGGVTIHTKSFLSKRKPSSPVVQFAKSMVRLGDNGEIVEFELRFFTRAARKRWESVDMPDEPLDLNTVNANIEDADIKDYIAKHRPDYMNDDGLIESVLSNYSFMPDTTIFKAHITVADSSPANVITIFSGKIASSFVRRSRYEYVHRWVKGLGDLGIDEALLRKYCSQDGAYQYGTSVWFEDITGHVSTPEKTIFRMS